MSSNPDSPSPNTSLLVAVDFSAGTDTLLKVASALAGELGASLLLAHVVEPMAAYVPVGASMDVISPPPADLVTSAEPVAQERLEKLAKTLPSGIQSHFVVLNGLAVEEILDQASRIDSRMILLGSHGHGALYHLFSGSVVTGILKRADRPVLVVPIAREADE